MLIYALGFFAKGFLCQRGFCPIYGKINLVKREHLFFGGGMLTFGKRFKAFLNMNFFVAFARVREEKAIPGWLMSRKIVHLTKKTDIDFLSDFMEKHLGWNKTEAQTVLMRRPVYHGEEEPDYFLESKDKRISFLVHKCPGTRGEWEFERLSPDDEDLSLEEYGEVYEELY